MTSPDDQDPLFSIVKGSPTDDELAAVMIVLSAQFGRPRQEQTTLDHAFQTLVTGLAVRYYKAVAGTAS